MLGSMAGRTRMSADERRDDLLDQATSIVVEFGVPACTIDAVSRRGGVTPQLVHRLFGARPDLLAALFRREHERFQRSLTAALDGADSLEEVVHLFVTANFDQLSTSTALGRLSGTPEIADAERQAWADSTRRAGRLLQSLVRAETQVDAGDIDLALRMGSAASIAAGRLANDRDAAQRADDIERATRFIVSGLRALGRDATPSS